MSQTELEAAELVASHDLRPLPRPQRHTLVFQQFEALVPGQAFQFTNDHDPLGLLYQFQQFFPGQFHWTYKVPGPEDWVIEVIRLDDTPSGADASHPDGCTCGSNGLQGCG